MAPQNKTKMYELGRLAGIREAIAAILAEAAHYPCDRKRAEAWAKQYASVVEALLAVGGSQVTEDTEASNEAVSASMFDQEHCATLPPPSGGEKADPAGKCVLGGECRHYPPETCPVHAPKPAAERP